MSFKNLFRVLDNLYPLSTELQRALIREMSPISYPKNYLLHEAPRIAEYAYFIQSGFAISYFYVKGKRKIQHVWKADQIMFLPTSFFEQTPSREHIELMNACELICISQPSALKLFNDFPETNVIYRKIMNQYYEEIKERVSDMHFLSTPERLKKLLNRFPEVEQILTQEDVASYLGITPQSLSRIKRNN